MSKGQKTTQSSIQSTLRVKGMMHGYTGPSVDGWMDGARICVAGLRAGGERERERVDNMPTEEQPGGRKQVAKKLLPEREWLLAMDLRW